MARRSTQTTDLWAGPQGSFDGMRRSTGSVGGVSRPRAVPRKVMSAYLSVNRPVLTPQKSNKRNKPTDFSNLEAFDIHQARAQTAQSFDHPTVDWDRRTTVTNRGSLDNLFEIRTTDPVLPTHLLASKSRMAPPLTRGSHLQGHVSFQNTTSAESVSRVGSRGIRSRGEGRASAAGGVARVLSSRGSTAGSTARHKSADGAKGLGSALLADTGAGDGSWRSPNPRALAQLPMELLVSGRLDQVVALLSNPHFLLQKTRERGVREVIADMEKADKNVRSRLALAPQESIYVMRELLGDWRSFVSSNAQAIEQFPPCIFALGKGCNYSSVAASAQTSAQRADAKLGAIHRLLDPYLREIGDEPSDDHQSVCRMLIAKRELQVLKDHGVHGAMDFTGLERIQVAELKLLHALTEVRDHVAASLYAHGGGPDWFETLGSNMCTLLGVDMTAQMPSPWDEDVFSLLYDFIGEGHVAWEPSEAFVHLLLDTTKLQPEEEEMFEGPFTGGFTQSWSETKRKSKRPPQSPAGGKGLPPPGLNSLPSRSRSTQMENMACQVPLGTGMLIPGVNSRSRSPTISPLPGLDENQESHFTFEGGGEGLLEVNEIGMCKGEGDSTHFNLPPTPSSSRGGKMELPSLLLSPIPGQEPYPETGLAPDVSFANLPSVVSWFPPPAQAIPTGALPPLAVIAAQSQQPAAPVTPTFICSEESSESSSVSTTPTSSSSSPSGRKHKGKGPPQLDHKLIPSMWPPRVVHNSKDKEKEAGIAILSQVCKITGLPSEAVEIMINQQIATVKISCKPPDRILGSRPLTPSVELPKSRPSSRDGVSVSELATNNTSPGLPQWPARLYAHLIRTEALQPTSTLRMETLVMDSLSTESSWRNVKLCISLSLTAEDESLVLTHLTLPSLRSFCRGVGIRLSWTLLRDCPTARAPTPSELAERLDLVSKSKLPVSDASETTFCIAVAGPGYTGDFSGASEVPEHVRRGVAALSDDLYGWVAQEHCKDWPLHELELCQGLLRSGPSSHGFLFKRWPVQEDAVSLKNSGVEGAIKDFGMGDRVIYYGGQGGERQGSWMFEFGQLFYSAVRRTLSALCPPGGSTGGIVSRWRLEHEEAKRQYAARWCPGTREITLRAIHQAASAGHMDSSIIILQGPCGSGKSTLLAKYADQMSLQNGCFCTYSLRETWCFGNVISAATSDLARTLEDMQSMKQDCSKNTEASEADEEVSDMGLSSTNKAGCYKMEGNMFEELLSTAWAIAQKGRNVTILLDGLYAGELNTLIRVRDNFGAALRGMIGSGAGVSIVVTRDADDPTPLLESMGANGVVRIDVPLLTHKEREIVCSALIANTAPGTNTLAQDLAYICKFKSGSLSPRYLQVAAWLLVKCGLPPSDIGSTLREMYQRDVLPVLDKACGRSVLSRILPALCGEGGLSREELGFVLGGRGGGGLYLERILDRLVGMLGEGTSRELGIKCMVLRECIFERYGGDLSRRAKEEEEGWGSAMLKREAEKWREGREKMLWKRETVKDTILKERESWEKILSLPPD